MKLNQIRYAILPALLLSLGAVATAQTGSIQGVVTENGVGVKDMLIKIERTDVKGNYQVKTKKKGDFFHAGLPLGTYNVGLEIDGQIVDRVNGVKLGMGTSDPIKFDLTEIKNRQQAAQSGGAVEPPKEVIASMSPEEKKKYEEALKKRQEQLSKNKELNDTFNLGMMAKKEGNLDVALENLKKASEIDGNQDVIFANLADVQSALAEKKTGDERKQMLTEAVASYQKAIELKPDAAAYYNNLGLAQIKSGDAEGGQANLAKAAQMDPANGGRYYFNLGAVMVNSGNTDGAVDAFKKATEVDPNYAEAYYQLGTAMVGKAETKEDGSIIPAPGTVEAFQKYLELKPEGANAPSAQMMITSLTGAVETEFSNKPKKKK
ncbi:MAG: tetratricopeptide repeat protein [Acidobacteria bacterium]|nr:tetratricopeptide repeat protein [Acidobacteriota bacterium]